MPPLPTPLTIGYQERGERREGRREERRTERGARERVYTCLARSQRDCFG